MSDASKLEDEVKALQAIAAALDSIDTAAQRRVMKYILDRLDLPIRMSTAASAVEDVDIDVAAPDAVVAGALGSSTRQASQSRIIDIRSLVAEKRPRTAIEMAVLVAYYLSELAPERQSAITADDLKTYFKQGAYPLPSAVRYTLTNAKAAGLLAATARGAYKLTPVGHNLVVHGLPADGTVQPAAVVRQRRTGSSASATKKGVKAKKHPRTKK